MIATLVVRRFALVAMLAIGGCTTVIPYEPPPAMTRDQARAIIRQAFEEQPEDLRPVTVEIADDAIRLGFSAVELSFLTGGVTTVAKRESYYFSSLADLRLEKHMVKTRWQVWLASRDGSVSRWVVFYEERRAASFLGAVARMKATN